MNTVVSKHSIESQPIAFPIEELSKTSSEGDVKTLRKPLYEHVRQDCSLYAILLRTRLMLRRDRKK